MAIDELKDLIKRSFPGFLIDSAYDYGEIVVFNLVPRDYTRNNLENCHASMSFSINKDNKEIKKFFPFDLPIDVYESGKKVV